MEASHPSTPSRPSRRARADFFVPFIPMIVAFAVAAAAHYYYGSTPSHTMAHPAASTAPATSPSALVKQGQTAPDFTLDDAHGGKVTLSQLVERGPVLFIYFMGYNCPRCVAHLIRLDERVPEFEATGTRIIALSPSTVTEYKDSIDQYGDFRFPLLSDESFSVAKAYGLVQNDSLYHAAIIIDRSRKVRFASAGAHPYDDEENLLQILSSLEKK